MTNPQHNATDFYVSLLDNDFYEIAASSLLDFPEGSTVYLDTYVSLIWSLGVWLRYLFLRLKSGKMFRRKSVNLK